MENEEFIREFLEESEENIDQLDQDFVMLEQNPGDLERLGSIYRAIHTIKGTSGFFGFSKLGGVTHSAENLLSRLRNGDFALNQDLTTALLRSVDAVREVLDNISRDGVEGDGDYRELNRTLDDFAVNPPPADTPSSAESHANVSEENQVEAEENRDREQVSDVHDKSMLGVIELANEVSGLIADGLDEEKDTPDKTEESLGDFGSLTAAPESAGGDINEIADRVKKNGSMSEGHHETVMSDNKLAERSIRVDVGLLNQLMDLVGELVLARNQLLRVGAPEKDQRLNNVTQQVNRITTDLQERISQTRMQPIGNIWGKYPRLVRDLAIQCGKEVELLIEGDQTEVDKSVLEAIKDPFTHLIRNAIDHGLETPEARTAAGKKEFGKLHLRAWHQGGQVNIKISDNGRGIDATTIRERAITRHLLGPEEAHAMSDKDIIQLIFTPGFSTAAEVTDISGRGVGMDVVKTNIEKIGGTIELQSTAGVGTAVKIRIPLTLAIIPALIIQCNHQRFAIPQGHLVEMLRINQTEMSGKIELIRNAPVYRLRGKLLPLVYLSELFGYERSAPDSKASGQNVVVLQTDNRRFGLVVDDVDRTEEIVVKALHPVLGSIPQLAGATVMGDGRVALILDVLGLAGSVGLSVQDLRKYSQLKPAGESDQKPERILVFRLASDRRVALALSEIDRIEEFPKSAVEQLDSSPAVQYRGQIMPLIPLENFLGEVPAAVGDSLFGAGDAASSVKCIVIKRGENFFGLIVHEIVDVSALNGPVREKNTVGHPIRGAAVVDGKVTDILDAGAVLEAVGLVTQQPVGAAT